MNDKRSTISLLNDLKIFIVSKIIALVIFFVNHLILVKYTKLYDEVK